MWTWVARGASGKRRVLRKAVKPGMGLGGGWGDGRKDVGRPRSES